MKVVMVSDYALGTPFGGVQTHVYHLARHISTLNNVKLHLIALSDRNEDLRINGIQFHFIKKSKIPRIFTIPRDSWFIKKKIIEINPDIVHVHSASYPHSIVVGIISGKYPTVLTIHGLIRIEYKFNSGLNFFAGIVSMVLEKYALSRVKDIIVCSPSMQDLLNDKPDAKISVIPNGVEYDEIKNIQHFLPSETFHGYSILYVGLLENKKGVDLLLRSIPLIKDEIQGINVYIAGKGSQEVKLRKLAKKLRIEDIVKFIGYIKGKEKYSYFKSADISVVPSRYEPFGIVILESMASGTPVVASDVGGIPLLVEDGVNGFLVKPGDVKDLADKILILLKDKPLRDKMGEKSELKAKNFDWTIIAEKTLEVYEELNENRKIE